MVVSSVDYGTFKSHSGTLVEVCGALIGVPSNKIKAFYFDSTAGKHIAIQGK